jgi:hypothetical protein
MHHIVEVSDAYPDPRKGFEMTEQFKIGEQFQNVGKEGFETFVRSFGEANKGFQAIAAEVTDYSKTAFEDASRAFQQLASAKSAEQAFEIQSQYAKKAYDTYVAQASKLGEMWVDLARATYKPVERAVAKKVA